MVNAFYLDANENAGKSISLDELMGNTGVLYWKVNILNSELNILEPIKSFYSRFQSSTWKLSKRTVKLKSFDENGSTSIRT